MTYLLSSAGALIVDRNTWTTRANQAWGPSDNWGSGNSWEYLTGYHGWTNREYLGGAAVAESWEARSGRYYTERYSEGYAAGYAAGVAAAQPPASPVVIQNSATVTAGGADGWTANLTSVTLDRAGQWLIEAFMSEGNIACGARVTNSGGSPIGNYNGYFWGLDRAGDTTNGNPRGGDWVMGSYAAGTVHYAQGARGGPSGGTLLLRATFIPTQANPK